jgi:hypothetical protein
MGRQDGQFLRAFFNYLCETPKLPKLVLESERKTIFLHFRATIAIYASIFFWIGSWNLLTEQQPYGENDQHSFELFVDGYSRELSYILVGVTILFATDTLYGNAGLPGGYYPPLMICTTKFAILPRAIIGLVGSGTIVLHYFAPFFCPPFL